MTTPTPRKRHPVDVAVDLLAEEQDGYWARYQARERGAYRSLVTRRVVAEDWVEHAGGTVLSRGGLPKSQRGDLRIAQLSMGPRAMVSFESAGALYTVEGFRLLPATILVPHGEHHESDIAVVHQSRHMPEPVMVRGFPTTPLLRTVVDLASVVRGPVRMGRIIDEVVARKMLTIDAIHRGYEWTAAHHRPGASVLAGALAGRTYGYVPTVFELGTLLDAILSTIPGIEVEREVDLPRRTQEPHRVDRLIRHPRLILEGDGRLWHARLDQMEKDRRRDRAALSLGYPTARYTYWELTEGASDVRAEIIDLLAAVESMGSSSPADDRAASG